MLYAILFTIIGILTGGCFYFSFLYSDMKAHMEHYRKLYSQECKLTTSMQMDINNKASRIRQLEHQIQDLYEEKNIVREARKIKDIRTTLFINERNIEFYTGNDIRKKLAISMADELADYIEYYIDSENYTQFGRGIHGRIKIISMED